MPSLQHDRPWRQEGIDSESGAAAMDDHSAGGHAQPAASVRASQHSGAVRASEGGAHEVPKRQHLFSHLYRPVPRHSAGETKKLPKARGTDSGAVVSAHQDVVGEKELRDFLTEYGFGDRKAYWVSCLPDYKGPRSCKKLSEFLGQCRSIEMYVEGDGKESIRLAAGFVPLGDWREDDTEPAPRTSVVSAHQDVVGEKELRDFLTEKGFGDRKAYWLSCLQDYKGPRSCKKLSKILEQCRSIEMYVEGDGKQSIRLAAAFVPAT